MQQLIHQFNCMGLYQYSKIHHVLEEDGVSIANEAGKNTFLAIKATDISKSRVRSSKPSPSQGYGILGLGLGMV